jgi:hypothetical protein
MTLVLGDRAADILHDINAALAKCGLSLERSKRQREVETRSASFRQPREGDERA